MARILEHNSKELLNRLKIPVPPGSAAENPGQAQEIAERIGLPVVVKALVPAGKRGKAGAIGFADTAEEAYTQAKRILEMTVARFPVGQVLIEKKLSIQQELYISITIDENRRMPVIIASTCGGIDIEELNKKHPDKISQTHVNPFVSLPMYKAIEIWSELGLEGDILRQAGVILFGLYQSFIEFDATLLEINPLVVTTDNKVIAAASVLNVDESALYRQPQLQSLKMGSSRAWRPLTELEKHMVAVNEQEAYRGTARYTEFDKGDIGFMCGGGGASLLLMDAVKKAGGRPANYSEVGGNPTENKVYGLCKGILSKPGVKGFFLAHNITNNTQIDVVARGVVRALKELNINPLKFPVVVREAGTHDAEGKKIFDAAGIEYHGEDITLNQAAQLIVSRMREAYPDYDQWGVE